MGYRIGNGFKGSPSLQTSVANAEILPAGYSFYKFNFNARTDCTIIINGEEIYVDAGIFKTNETDAPITSFKIKEDGLFFTWCGVY